MQLQPMLHMNVVLRFLQVVGYENGQQFFYKIGFQRVQENVKPGCMQFQSHFRLLLAGEGSSKLLSGIGGESFQTRLTEVLQKQSGSAEEVLHVAPFL